MLSQNLLRGPASSRTALLNGGYADVTLTYICICGMIVWLFILHYLLISHM